MDKIKISAVSYLNTLPFQYGIDKSPDLVEQIELSRDIPSECARRLLNDEVDLGLIPVAVIPQIPQAEIISDFCIGAEGEVHTVLLLSEVPLEEIEEIYLDYQSRTSVALCRVLCAEYWKISPRFLKAEAGFEQTIGGKTAGVIIGDRTFHLEKDFAYRLDLAEAWKEHTSLPFVFAAWVANKKIRPDFIADFNRALAYGIENIDRAIEQDQQKLISTKELSRYLKQYISYPLTAEKKKGLALFLEKLAALPAM